MQKANKIPLSSTSQITWLLIWTSECTVKTEYKYHRLNNNTTNIKNLEWLASRVDANLSTINETVHGEFHLGLQCKM